MQQAGGGDFVRLLSPTRDTLYDGAMSGPKSTILVNVFDQAVATNLFVPGFRRVIESHTGKTRIIVTTSDSRVQRLTESLADLCIKVVALPRSGSPRLEEFALFTARNAIPTHAVRQIQEDGLDGAGRLPLPKYLYARILWLLSHIRLFRSFLKLILPLCFDSKGLYSVFEKYTPDVVFATTIYAANDIRFLLTAKKRGIPALGMIKSWDNLTSKDMMLVPPDRLIVHNNVVRDEAIHFHRFPEKNIDVIGVPQFDWYADTSFPLAREEFFERAGLDPNKALLTYSAMGTWLAPHEHDVIKMLAKLVRENAFVRESQLLVRLHPAYPDDKETLSHVPGVIVDQPGNAEWKGGSIFKADWKFSSNDIQYLASTVKWSDIVLNSGSTMILDAVCFDTPVIGIAFDGEKEEGDYWRSTRRLFLREHCATIAKTGGLRIVKNKTELIAAINGYLEDRNRDHENRMRLVDQQTGTVGGAGERLAQAMLRFAGIND